MTLPELFGTVAEPLLPLKAGELSFELARLITLLLTLEVYYMRSLLLDLVFVEGAYFDRFV
jgi:hypothetical protein